MYWLIFSLFMRYRTWSRSVSAFLSIRCMYFSRYQWLPKIDPQRKQDTLDRFKISCIFWKRELLIWVGASMRVVVLVSLKTATSKSTQLLIGDLEEVNQGPILQTCSNNRSAEITNVNNRELDYAV